MKRKPPLKTLSNRADRIWAERLWILADALGDDHLERVVTRFWTKVDVRGPDDCWPWRAALNRSDDGYGVFFIATGLPVPWRSGLWVAHRFAYELEVAAVPPGLQLDHLCRNRPCVNPAHLETVTSAENTRRGMGACGIHARQTHCVNGHPFVAENLRANKHGHRACKQCHRERENARYHRKKVVRLAT